MKLFEDGKLCTGENDIAILVTEFITFFSTELVNELITPFVEV